MANSGHVVALVDRAACTLGEGSSLAQEARSRVSFDGVVPEEVSDPVAGLNEDALMQMGAAARSAQMAGEGSARQASSSVKTAFRFMRSNAFGNPWNRYRSALSSLHHNHRLTRPQYCS